MKRTLETEFAPGAIDQDALARAFAERMDLARGYGEGAVQILRGILAGVPWTRASRGAFRGRGSFGNGAAMRVAPLGAFFADDLSRCVHEATLSAEVTHAHEEGTAGAVAVAVAAAMIWTHREAPPTPHDFLSAVLERTPKGYTHEGIDAAIALDVDADIVTAAQALGNGSGVTAPDTVPLCLWIAARQNDYVDALWETVSALGDRDTTCAIVGGLVGLRSFPPDEWRREREPLPIETLPIETLPIEAV